MYDIAQNTNCTQNFKVYSSFKKEKEGAEIQPSQRDLEHQAIFLEDETLCHDATACNYECLCTAKFQWRFILCSCYLDKQKICNLPKFLHLQKNFLKREHRKLNNLSYFALLHKFLQNSCDSVTLIPQA